MEIVGKIINAAPLMSGTSTKSGKAWQSQDFVVETEERFPRKCMFNVFGEDRIREFALKVGDRVKVHIDINAHEYNGRWFNEVSAWKVERIS